MVSHGEQPTSFGENGVREGGSSVICLTIYFADANDKTPQVNIEVLKSCTSGHTHAMSPRGVVGEVRERDKEKLPVVGSSE